MFFQLALQILAVQVLILLALRPLILWYLKINPAVKLLESIDASLKCLPAVRQARTSPKTPARRVA
jgi:hypothetical protein